MDTKLLRVLDGALCDALGRALNVVPAIELASIAAGNVIVDIDKLNSLGLGDMARFLQGNLRNANRQAELAITSIRCAMGRHGHLALIQNAEQPK